jgi:hypothetical protein
MLTSKAIWHFLDLKGRAMEQAVLRAISILQEVEVSSLSSSLDLLNSFSIAYTLFPFRELDTLKGLFKCSLYPYVVFKRQSVQTH